MVSFLCRADVRTVVENSMDILSHINQENRVSLLSDICITG